MVSQKLGRLLLKKEKAGMILAGQSKAPGGQSKVGKEGPSACKRIASIP
jgi:hypothetical protein